MLKRSIKLLHIILIAVMFASVPQHFRNYLEGHSNGKMGAGKVVRSWRANQAFASAQECELVCT
jgi:hypothetical protein